MKKDILKIAGVKSEAEFYKKFPTEEAFMAKHGGAFKKAKMGASMVKKQLTQLTDFSNPPQAQDGVDVPQYQYSGMPLKANLQTPAFMQPFNFNAPAYQQYQPMGLPDSRSEDIVSPSVYDITGMDRYYGKPLKPKSPKPFVTKVPPKENKLTKDNIFDAGLDIVQGIVQSKEDRENMLRAKQFSGMSDIALQAASTRDDIRNRDLRPEDMMFDPNQLSRSYGTGYDVLQATAEDGAKIGGNPTEIQNMYNPGDIYSNLGYEPLDDSNKVKQFQGGGAIFANWKQDLTSFGADSAGDLGGGLGSLIGGGKGQASGASKIGGGIGQLAGTALGGPLGGVIGSAAGSLLGGVIGGAQQKKIDQMLAQGQANAANASFQQLQQGQFKSFMEHGGELKYLSHDWQPQVITQFGEYNMKDLLRDDPTMDTLRSGGHLKNYTAPSQRAMSTDRMAMGGQLKTTWGGYAEPISHNPYLPGSGETVMFRGKSHEESDGNGHTGIGVKYGQGAQDSYTDYAEYGTEQADADVEVERGETGVELKDITTGETSMIVYGDMVVPSYVLSELGEKDAKEFKGKKFKNIDKEYAKQEMKQNKKIEKGLKLINSIYDDGPFGQLKFNAGKALVDGGNQELKIIADKRIGLAGGQNAILDTSKEFGVKSAELAKGKIKQDPDSEMAKFGGKFTQAQVGTEVIDIPLVRDQYGNPVYNQPIYGSSLPQVVVAGKKASTKKASGKKASTKKEEKLDFSKLMKVNPEADKQMIDEFYAKNPDVRTEAIRALDPFHAAEPGLPTFKVSDSPTKEKKDKSGIEDVLRQLQPYLIPSNQEDFDYGQIAPELASLAMNPLKAVQAQTFQPLLETPYSVSFQDQLNANQADFNALQRQVGYNPAAASALAAQKYAANSAILGQQFRANQEMQMGAYNRNRGILNDATLKNLAILDQQYVRGEQAATATKGQAQAALSSIADKIAKHKLENRTLGVYENMYNYRFGPKGRAINVNAPYDFNLDMASLNSDELETARKYRELQEKKGVKKEKDAKNGSIVKAIKNL